MDRILAASAGLPTWTRWASWLAAGTLVFLATAFRHPLWVAAAVALAAFTAFANLPAIAFDGPLPFSSYGVHVRSEVFRWDEVVRVEAAEDGRHLSAIVSAASGERVVPLRVRGARTRDELRAALARCAPDKVAF